MGLLALKPTFGMINGLLLIGSAIFALGLLGVWRLRESYGRDLDKL